MYFAGEGERSGKFCEEVTVQLSLKVGCRSTMGTRQGRAGGERARGEHQDRSLAETTRALKASCAEPRGFHPIQFQQRKGQVRVAF